MYSMAELQTLKSKILEHKKPDEWGTKERGRIAQYENYKKSIVERIGYVEDMTIKVNRHMKTIDEWVGTLKKWGIYFFPEDKPTEPPVEEKETRQSQVLPEE